MYQYKTVRGLLRNRARWAKYTLARDANGAEIGPESSKAVSFCLLGAAHRICPNSYAQVAEKIRKAILACYPAWSKQHGYSRQEDVLVSNFNDAGHRRFSQIQRVLNHANV